MVLGLPIWVIVTLVVIAVLVVMFRTMNQVFILSLFKQNLFYIVIAIVLIFFTIAITNIHRSNDIDYTSFEGVKFFVRAFFVWLGSVFKNLGNITGYAVQQDWFGNATGAGA